MTAPTPPRVVQVGRRPIVDYVTKDFDGFRQGMLALIPQLLPNWTDRSESDFGVVLIELFAYVADILSYYQDRVANEAYLGTATQRCSVAELLRLIDYQIDPGLAAQVLLHIDVTGTSAVRVGGESPFRVRATGIPGEPDRVFEVTRPFELTSINNSIAVRDPSAPFTTTLPQGSNSLKLLTASHAIGRGDTIYLEETTAAGALVQRSVPLQVIDVRTSGNTDTLTWEPPLAQSFAIRATVIKGNNVPASHGETISDEPIYVGNGTPRQTMRLSRRPVTHLLASRGGRRRRSRAELTIRVNDVAWQQTDSFFDSGPSDTHYVATIDDDDHLTVRFGTGQRGAVVPAGARVQATYRVGLGRAGNVGPGAISVAVTSLQAVTGVINPFAATGGAERETIEEAKISGPGSVISQERAVTLQDYELLSTGFPGVAKAKARVGLRGGYKVVCVYVVPEGTGTSPPPMPSADLKEALRQELEARQPVNRMAGVDVLDPTYVPIHVSVDIHVRADASAAAVKTDVKTALEELLSFARVDFGGVIRVGDIYATLYPIPGISYVQLQRLGRSAPVAASSGGNVADVAVGEHELPYRGQISIATFGGLL